MSSREYFYEDILSKALMLIFYGYGPTYVLFQTLFKDIPDAISTGIDEVKKESVVKNNELKKKISIENRALKKKKNFLNKKLENLEKNKNLNLNDNYYLNYKKELLKIQWTKMFLYYLGKDYSRSKRYLNRIESYKQPKQPENEMEKNLIKNDCDDGDRDGNKKKNEKLLIENDPNVRVLFCFVSGLVNQNLNYYDDAIFYFKKSLKYLKDQNMIEDVNGFITNTLFSSNTISKSSKKKKLNIFEKFSSKSNDEDFEFDEDEKRETQMLKKYIIYFNIAFCYYKKGFYLNSIHSYQKSLKHFEKELTSKRLIKNIKEIYNLRIGECYYLTNDWDNSLIFLKNAKENSLSLNLLYLIYSKKNNEKMKKVIENKFSKNKKNLISLFYYRSIPDEIMITIFEYLPLKNIQRKAKNTCTYWNKLISNHKPFWKNTFNLKLFMNSYITHLDKTSKIPYMKSFKKQDLLEIETNFIVFLEKRTFQSLRFKNLKHIDLITFPLVDWIKEIMAVKSDKYKSKQFEHIMYLIEVYCPNLESLTIDFIFEDLDLLKKQLVLANKKMKNLKKITLVKYKEVDSSTKLLFSELKNVEIIVTDKNYKDSLSKFEKRLKIKGIIKNLKDSIEDSWESYYDFS